MAAVPLVSGARIPRGRAFRSLHLGNGRVAGGGLARLAFNAPVRLADLRCHRVEAAVPSRPWATLPCFKEPLCRNWPVGAAVTALDAVESVAIAALAMFGLGLPLAWLLPAPAGAPWVHRIAVAPLYAIVLASSAAWGMGALGIGLHPTAARSAGHCWVGTCLAEEQTTLAYPRSPGGGRCARADGRGSWCQLGCHVVGVRPLPSQPRLQESCVPGRTSGLRQLVGPRDGPQGVANGASRRGIVLSPRASHPPRLGTSDARLEFAGVTAASAVLAACITLPLACVTLARQFAPENTLLWQLTGFFAICFPGLTQSFSIGSVVLICGAAMYCAGLACVWHWLHAPSRPAALALALAGLGLLLLHVAEAWGLALVALASIPSPCRPSRPASADGTWRSRRRPAP